MSDFYSSDEMAAFAARMFQMLGPLRDVSDASIYYSVEWLRVLSERKDKRAPLLLRLLLKGGHVDKDGRPRVKLRRPVLKTFLGDKFLEFHEAVTRGLARLDEAAALLKISMLSSPWYDHIRRQLVEVMRRASPKRVILPYIGEGFILEDFAELNVEALGYDVDREALRDAAEYKTAQLQVGDGCTVTARNFDAAVMFDALHWSVNPFKELMCISEALKPGGKFFVGNAVVESMPSISAVLHMAGAPNYFTARELDDILSAVGLVKVKVYSKTPYYMAVWERR
ncbi:MAG: class I SAM-dependent methyltransferase [Thermoproteus sp.]